MPGVSPTVVDVADWISDAEPLNAPDVPTVNPPALVTPVAFVVMAVASAFASVDDAVAVVVLVVVPETDPVVPAVKLVSSTPSAFVLVDVAVAFAELLGDPNTNLEVREFALNTMKGVKEENLVLALLNTYNMGKTEYYSLLNTMLAALGEFDDPEVKKAVIEIAHSNDYPMDIRKKAIDNLAAFNDPSVLNGLLPMLENKDNYVYYDNIINMVYKLGEEKKNAESVRRMAFKAHFSKREYD